MNQLRGSFVSLSLSLVEALSLSLVEAFVSTQRRLPSKKTRSKIAQQIEEARLPSSKGMEILSIEVDLKREWRKIGWWLIQKNC